MDSTKIQSFVGVKYATTKQSDIMLCCYGLTLFKENIKECDLYS
jgi:hypothetical protein